MSTAHKRDRHGFRGTPEPAHFDLYELPDSALLTELEVASVGRWSTNTLTAWRRQPDHPLKWIAIRGGFVRYRAGSVKAYLGAGMPRPRRRDPPPVTKSDAARPQRRLRRAAVKQSRPRATADVSLAPEVS